MDKISYAIGLSMGQNLMGSGVTSLEYADLAAGIKDVLEKNQPQISYQEAQQVLGKFFSELEKKIAGQAKAAGETFLAENAKREGVKVTESGLQYEVLKATIGQKPKQQIKCAYTTKVHSSMVLYSIVATSVAKVSLSV